MMYVAIGRHLIVGTLVLTDVDAKFDANRDKIATTKNFFIHRENQRLHYDDVINGCDVSSQHVNSFTADDFVYFVRIVQLF